ncbi:hypothetical protein RHGRI_008054 [Rhododendron griersonianum]|uniref:Uncharacterized protein n=1 Tax=Rhododendron griersonianum TaxID=479676 RepID=A0AAV6L0X7_9ERIC|nr:hypothetical protein RHGRI_008054 [Rhododendron griersonianum]
MWGYFFAIRSLYSTYGRVITSSSQFSSSGPRPTGEEDDDVDGTNDEVDDDCTGGKKQVDDLAIQGKSEADKESINAPSLNPDMLLLKGVPHQARVEKETEGTAATLIVTGNKVQLSSLPRTADQVFQKKVVDINDTNSNSYQGLDSFVQDSQSPSQVESQASESTNKAQVSEAQEEIRGNDLVRQHEEVERTAMLTYGPVVIERPSQVPGIELEVDLNQRKLIDLPMMGAATLVLVFPLEVDVLLFLWMVLILAATTYIGVDAD